MFDKRFRLCLSMVRQAAAVMFRYNALDSTQIECFYHDCVKRTV